MSDRPKNRRSSVKDRKQRSKRTPQPRPSVKDRARQARSVTFDRVPRHRSNVTYQRPVRRPRRRSNEQVASKPQNGLHGFLAVLQHLPRPSRLSIVVLVLAFVVAGLSYDAVSNNGKVFQGVYIGDVNVSGMSLDQAIEAVSQEYSPRVTNNICTFFVASDDQAHPKMADTDASIDEQLSYEESLKNRTQWTVPATVVEAVFDVDALTDEALAVGRGLGPFSRVEAAFGGWNIQPSCTFNDEVIARLAKEMTTAVGTERVNFGVQIEDSVASVTDGHDGNEVTAQWILDRLNQTFLGTVDSQGFVLETTPISMQVSKSDAQGVADLINGSIAQGVSFTFEDQSWEATKDDLASFITTWLDESGESPILRPVFDEDATKNALLKNLHTNISNGDSLDVRYRKQSDGSILVSTSATGTVPLAADVVKQLNETFFVDEARSETPQIAVSSTELPSSCSFEEAKSYGLVTEISSYTTQYSSGNDARVHNIHTASDLLNNSIISANNGRWSFNDTAGEATEVKGYQGAGAIVAGEYSDAIGGGICQVATTVFNAVYIAGYPVDERHNHSLRISSYPEGRDAAIAYPYLDLVWHNDTSSDVVLMMSYTDTSVTATLWGVDPGYQVSTEYGEWQKGGSYSTVYKSDDTVASGKEYVSTTGVDGSSISITRTVKDASGTVLHTDTFESNYAPKNKVVVRGTKS